MAAQALFEQRSTAVETVLSELQPRLTTLSLPSKWLDQSTGSCKDQPAFDEVLAFECAFWVEGMPPGRRRRARVKCLLDTDHVRILPWQAEPEFTTLRMRTAQQSKGKQRIIELFIYIRRSFIVVR